MDHVDELDGKPHFYNVPAAWLPDLGRLAVLSARIEDSAYRIATGVLGLSAKANGRTRPITQEATRIRRRLDDPATVRWFDVLLPGWSGRVYSWAEQAPTTVDETRNLYLHANYVHYYQGEGRWEPYVDNRLDPRGAAMVTAADIADAVQRLRPVEVEGTALWLDGMQTIQWARAQVQEQSGATT